MSKENYDPHAPGNGAGASQPESAAPTGTAAQRDAAAAEYSRQAGEQAMAAAVEPSALQALEAEVADLKDQVLRAYAEVDNIRKRGERERLDTQKYAVSKFARDMLSVADNLERALAAAPKESADPSLKGFVDGVTVTERSLAGILERHGVKRIEAHGAIFDPHLHQAVMEQPDPTVPSGTIVRVFEAGYLIEDRVLRPASVVVAKGGAKPTKPSAQDAGATPANGGDQGAAPEGSGYGNGGPSDPTTGA